LQLDPNFAQAFAYLSLMLSTKVNSFRSENPLTDQERAESTATRAVELQPHYGLAHLARVYSIQARVFVGKSGQWETLIAEAEAAIADDRNLADAYANLGFNKVFLGHAAEGFSGVETAFSLSPRDPQLGNWEFFVCHLHSHLAQWEQAIEWCRKSIVTQPADSIWSYLDIASAYAWTGRSAEAKQAVAEVLKTNPDFTVQTFNAIKWTENPTFKREYARLSEGLLKAGLPEGKSTSN
jgi:adenylate cyclase